MTAHFSAPWSLRLALVTASLLAVLACAAVAAEGFGALALAAIVLATAAFSVRGYSVVGEELLVHRVGWTTRLDLSRLTRAEFSPGATAGSLRTFGNGGLFAFVGHFRNAELGWYRAYATDGARTVVLDFVTTRGTERVVVTPDRPAEFVAALLGAETGGVPPYGRAHSK